MKRIIESYKRKLASEDGWVLKRGSQLRIALCYPNTYAIGMANLGFQAMYELFNNVPEVSCERVFLPDTASRTDRVTGAGPGIHAAVLVTRGPSLTVGLRKRSTNFANTNARARRCSRSNHRRRC